MGSMRIFRHCIRIPLLILGMTDFLILLGSVYAGAHLRFYYDPGEIAASIGWLLPRALVFGCVMLSSLTAMGLFQARLRERTVGVIFRIFTSYLVGTFGVMALFYVLPSLFTGRGTLALALGISFAGVTAAHLLFLHFAQDLLKRRVVILGAGNRANSLKSLRRAF